MGKLGSISRSFIWRKVLVVGAPALALLLTGCPADDPLPVGSVDGGSGGSSSGSGGDHGGSGGNSGSGGNATGGSGGQPGTMCGGIAGIHCAAGEYCELKPGECHVADVAGTCAQMPQACTANFDPVCGCDGKTYGNACAAASAGVSVSATGACPTTSDGGTHSDASPGDSSGSGKMCAGLAGIACPAGDYCKLADGDCKIADAAGTCTAKPGACSGDFVPVCGCDGKTYSNNCVAAAAGVSVASTGACP